MKCVQCGRTDSGRTDKPLQCTCYTWFVYTCAVCFATVLIGLVCCVYCTYMVVSINSAVTSCVGSNREETLSKTEKPLEESGLLQEEGLQDIISDETKESEMVEMPLTPINKIRRKRNDEEGKKNKNKKRRRGKGEKGKKKQKVQAAHFFLRRGLSDKDEMKRTVDVFQLATFINTRSNPFVAVDGKFYAKKKGLYLVYAQVLFEDSKASEVMKVVQKRDVGNTEIIVQEHYCFVSVLKPEKSYNNTCNIVALFFLEANDYLSVLNYYPEVHISYTSNSTFFGAVYLR